MHLYGQFTVWVVIFMGVLLEEGVVEGQMRPGPPHQQPGQQQPRPQGAPYGAPPPGAPPGAYPNQPPPGQGGYPQQMENPGQGGPYGAPPPGAPPGSYQPPPGQDPRQGAPPGSPVGSHPYQPQPGQGYPQPLENPGQQRPNMPGDPNQMQPQYRPGFPGPPLQNPHMPPGQEQQLQGGPQGHQPGMYPPQFDQRFPPNQQQPAYPLEPESPVANSYEPPQPADQAALGDFGSHSGADIEPVHHIQEEPYHESQFEHSPPLAPLSQV